MKARLLIGCFVCFLLRGTGFSADSAFRANDTIALIGGEDMVALADSGQLEAQIVQQPGLAAIKVRALAYEGDTVFEQHRQLNYPTWEQQLEKIGATVVIAQFGQMETLRSGSGADEFIQQYEALLQRLAGGKRQLVILSPTPFEKPSAPLPDLTARNAAIEAQLPRIHALADKLGAAFVDLYRTFPAGGNFTRDGIHLNDAGLQFAATEAARQLGLKPASTVDPSLLALLQAKNRLWFNYHRPQNWAFLHGDRTEQLFSRDYRDPKIRQLLLEMEEYVPLITAKEKEIIAHLRGINVEKN
jgi:GDSL-like Lipase/Acylhydrolase family